MGYKKFRWSRVYESSEEELVAFLQARKIVGERIHAEADAAHSEQKTVDAITIWCAEGSMVVKTDSATIRLQPGDAARFEASMTYTILPGMTNCTYYLTR